MKTMNSDILIVAGMHRSGTSLTASLLQRLGVDIGEKLVGPAYGNVKGHFENLEFVQFHQEILQANGVDQLGCTTEKLEVPAHFWQQAAALVQRCQQRSPIWGWKDPRTTLFLPFWQQLLPSAKFIFVYRSPWEVVDSLYRRATDSALLDRPDLAMAMWLHYNQQALYFYQQFPDQCLFANVYPIGARPDILVREINQKFALNLPSPPGDNFDQSLLVNEIVKTSRPSLIRRYFPDALELYDQLEAMAGELNSGITNDVIRPMSPQWAFKDWLDIRKLEKERKILKIELEEWQVQFEEARDRVVSLETELGTTQLELDGTSVRYQETLTKLLRIETELGETQILLDQAQFKLKQKQAEVEDLDTRRREAIDKLVATETQLGATQLELNGVQAKYSEALAKLVKSETELGQAQFHFQAKEAQFQEALVKIQQLEAELGQTQWQLQGTQAKLQEALAKIFELEGRLGQALGEIAAMKSSKFWKLREKWIALKGRARRFLQPQFVISLDLPRSWQIASSEPTELKVAGWCFHSGFLELQAIRASLGDLIVAGKYGIERGDVGSQYPAIPGAGYSGFEITISVPVGYHDLMLEVQDTTGKWHQIATYAVKVSQLQAAFDLPTIWQQRQGQAFFAGWCCHPEIPVTGLKLYCNDQAVDCVYGLPRKDVASVYPTWVNSDRSGFEALIESLPVGEWQIRLEVELATGETLSIPAPHPLQVQRVQLAQKIKVKTQEFNRYAGALRKRAQERKQRLGRLIPMPWEIPTILRRMTEMYEQQQRQQPGELLPPPGFEVPAPLDPYDAWLAVNQWNDHRRDYLQRRLDMTENLPKISVVMPVFNPPVEFLQAAIQSVVNQVYQNWELCIADDCSTNPAIRDILQQWAEQDSRIKVVFRPENGNISAATNSAAELATGEFIGFLDHDDELTPDALGEVALYLAHSPDTDFIYSDDDKIDTEGCRFEPQFKPDWSPELLLAYMYLGHFCAVRRTLFTEIGGLRLGLEGSQDYDFALRATEKAHKVSHIPLVLYHWRTAPGSTAVSGAEKPASFGAGQRAVQDALNRRQVPGEVYQPDWAVREHLGIFAPKFPDQGPSVTIIIPTKNQVKLLKACLDSLTKTTYQNYQILIIDNESDDPETLAYFQQISHQVLPVKNPDGKFNFAAINNRAAEHVETDFLLFLNNDTEIINPHWLSQMMGYAQIEGVGAVGGRLLFPDQRVQHGGILHGLHHGLAGHAFKLLPHDQRGYLSHAMLARNYLAVTAACLLTPRHLFLDLGKFDEKTFGVAYNDADYGYRLYQQGYRSVYCPDAELIHKEGHSRGFKDNPQEVAAFRQKYAPLIDPFYSPHLSLKNELFEIEPRHFFLPFASLEDKPQSPALKPVKILMASNSLEFTGAPLHQYEIALKLASNGNIQPIIFCTADGPLKTWYEQAGIPVIIAPHPLEHIYDQQGYEQALDNFQTQIKDTEIDVIYANTLENFFIIDCGHRLGIPTIWNIHESEPWQTYFDRFGPEIATQALKCFAFPYKIIFVADATRNRYLPLNSHHNFTVIHNGLDIQRLYQQGEQWDRQSARQALDIQPDEITILLLGTVCERKGQQDLIKALALLSPGTHTKIRCFIVGDRPSLYSHQLAALAAELPGTLRQRLTLVPETADVAKYYQAADIFVCTSRVESYPRVILEAMAYNLPIITTPVFGIVEQVRPEVNGLFYTPDRPEELAMALQTLVENENRRRELANNAKYVLTSLNTFEEMTQAYQQIFQEAYFINQSVGCRV